MNPGRELDTLIAEKVMGILSKDFEGLWKMPKRDCLGAGYHYSTDIADAWQVVEKIDFFLERRTTDDGLRERGAIWKTQSGEWCALYSYVDQLKGRKLVHINGESAPHAICLAALKALGITEPTKP